MWDGVDRLDDLVDIEPCISKEMIQIRDGYIHGGLVVNDRPIEQGDDRLSDGSTLGAWVFELALGRHAQGVGKIGMKERCCTAGWCRRKRQSEWLHSDAHGAGARVLVLEA